MRSIRLRRSPLAGWFRPGGGTDFDISGLQPCAYILWLSTTLNLTDGLSQVYGPIEDHIAFCKGG